MNLLITDKEIINFLFSQLDHTASCQTLELNETNTASAITEFLDRRNSEKYDPEKDNPKFKDKLTKGIRRDLTDYMERVISHIDNRKSLYANTISKNLNFFISQLGEENILTAYKNSKHQ